MQRKIKNVVKNYTPTEIKVREATSNDPWGPASILMSEIATLTFDALARAEIMPIIWKRLNDHGKNWRHVFKSLVLLEYLSRTGSDQIVQQCKDNIILIQTLREFQYVENGLDCGLNVREAAKSLFELLKDEERLKSERTRAAGSKARFGDMWSQPISTGELAGQSEKKYKPFNADAVEIEKYSPTSSARQTRSSKVKDPEIESSRPTNQNEEELQLQLALAMSKEDHNTELRKRKGEEIKLQMAIEESKKTAEQEKLWRKPSHFDADHETSSSAFNDPWGAAGATTNTVKDPWKSDFDAFPSTDKNNDLFAAPIYSTVQKTTPWEEVSAKYSLPSASSITDDFLEISNRHYTTTSSSLNQTETARLGHSNTSSSVTKLDNLLEDLWGGGASSGLNSGEVNGNGGVAQSKPADDQQQQKNRKKVTPEEFLGPNAKLVDFDDLVSMPKQPDNVNPFAMTTQVKGPAVNPFLAKIQQEEKSKRVPLNQLQSSVTPTSQLGQSFNYESQQQPNVIQSNQLGSFSTPALTLIYNPQPIAQNQNFNPFM